MRCEDLTRELASPTGGPSPAEIAGHLAACPSCAEWSRRAARFDRIWEATRPLEPSTDAMDALWANASAALDDRPAVVPATLRFEAPARRRRWAMAAFALAQAAALLVAALFLFRGNGALGPRPAQIQVADATTSKTPVIPDIDRPASTEPVMLDLKIGFDQMAVVRIGKQGEPRVEMLDQAHLFASSLIPEFTFHDEYNEWEIMASR